MVDAAKPILVIDNAIHRQILREGPWTERLLGDRKFLRTRKTDPIPDLATISGLVITGSEASANDDEDWILRQVDAIKKAVETDVPVLGICFGHQLVARALAGKQCVRRSPTPEFGWREIVVDRNDGLLAGLGGSFRSYCSHFDEVFNLPSDFEVMAHSDRCPVHAFSYRGGKAFGIQFHPEIGVWGGLALLLLLSPLLKARRLCLREVFSTVDSNRIGRIIVDNWLDRGNRGSGG